MNDKQFYNDFYSALEKAMEPSGGKLQAVDIPKNNGMMKGISIRFPNIDIAPTVYPDFYYQDLKDGKPMEKIVSDIRSDIMRTAPSVSRFDINNITHEGAITHLRAAVVNYDKNKDWLSKIPHERMEDLAVYAKWDFENGYTAKINDFFLAKTQLTKEEALKIAKTNTAHSSRFEGMDAIMSGILTDEGMDQELSEAMTREFQSAPFHVLTTESGIDGASLIACPDVLKAVQKQIGEDFYILPSSIHETLILPKSQMDDVEGLKAMVSTINENEVEPEERLSDNVYEYDGHSLKIAGSELKQQHSLSESITHHRSR